MSLLSLAVALWLPTVCNAFFQDTYGSHNDDTVMDLGVTTDPPSPSPWNPPPDTGTTQSSAPPSRWGASDGIDLLVAAFFLVAAGWLVLALLYSILVLIVVRMRARGQLDVYDEEFGRLYLLGTRCYIPFGFLLRRYVIAMNQERNRDGERITVRLMTREERRLAMERLLDQHNDQTREESPDLSETKKDDQAAASNDIEEKSHAGQTIQENTKEVSAPDDASEEEPVCSICLNEYEPTDDCFTSSVCSHQFHRACILEWLQRRANTECPCCRTPLVTDEQVWETVQEMREEHRRQIQKANRRGFFFRFRRGGNQPQAAQDDVTAAPTPPSSPTALTSFGSGDETQSEDFVQYDNVVAENVESATPRTNDLELGRRLYEE